MDSPNLNKLQVNQIAGLHANNPPGEKDSDMIPMQQGWQYCGEGRRGLMRMKRSWNKNN